MHLHSDCQGKQFPEKMSESKLLKQPHPRIELFRCYLTFNSSCLIIALTINLFPHIVAVYDIPLF